LAIASKDISAVYELLYNPNYTPRTSPNAHIEQMTVDGRPSHILMKEFNAEYYEVDDITNTIWGLVDGRRTIREIYDEAKRSDGSLTEKQVKDIIISLAEEGTIETTEPEIKQKRVEVVSAFQVDVQILKDISESLAGFFRVSRRLIKKQELPVAIGIAALGFALFFGTFLHIYADPAVLDIAGSAMLGFAFYTMIVLLPVYAVHELAHAAVCDYYGGKPREIGTGLYYLDAFFYCDTSDSWRLPRRARIMISAAGPLSTVVIASLLVFWSYFVPAGFGKSVLQISAFFGYYSTLANFSPVIETDGYYILADALNIYNLRDEAFSYIKRTFLTLLRRPVASVRQGLHRRRVILYYSIATIAWFAFFGYTTVWLLYVYGSSAYSALLGLSLSLLRVRAFNLAGVTVNIATLAYFAFFMSGYALAGAVYYQNIHMKGVKLETIHDKRVSAFLPIPSFIQRSRASELVEKAKKLAGKHSHSFSVTLEPPLCVAAMKLGKVDQSLDAMRGEMQEIEKSFRSLHREFLSRNLVTTTTAKQAMMESLLNLADQFPSSERKAATTAVSQFLKREDDILGYLLQSAFGTVWTLELSPNDYKRIRRDMFPTLIAEDLGGADLSGELEQFKRHEVLGSDTIAQLASEVESESKGVYKAPEIYQITALLEPIKSRLVFVGRTDRVEGSVVWLGGLYLYQAWTSYMGEALEDSALGLKSLRLAHTASLTKTQSAKLRDKELELLEQDLERLGTLMQTVENAMPKIESTYESALNFHETLETLMSNEVFDIGLYNPILHANAMHLEGLKEKMEKFRSEFEKASRRIAANTAVVREEHSRRVSEASSTKKDQFEVFAAGVRSWGWVGGSRNHTSAFDAEVRFMFTTARLVYSITLGSDIIL
jgi:hypothetical protein